MMPIGTSRVWPEARWKIKVSLHAPAAGRPQITCPAASGLRIQNSKWYSPGAAQEDFSNRETLIWGEAVRNWALEECYLVWLYIHLGVLASNMILSFQTEVCYCNTAAGTGWSTVMIPWTIFSNKYAYLYLPSNSANSFEPRTWI